MTAPRPIVVAGAGIGGLTAALSLAALGFRIVILEKADRLEEAGAGLQLSPNASRVLTDLGLAALLAPHVITPDAVSIMTARSGREIVRLPLRADDPDAPYWVLHRAHLQSALLTKVADNPAIELRLGCAVESINDESNGGGDTGIAIGYRRDDAPARETVSALIGADGVWSAVRQHVFPDIRATFSGLIAWRGSIAADRLPEAATPRRVQLWMGPHAHLVAYPMAGGRQINIVAIIPGDSSGQDRSGQDRSGQDRSALGNTADIRRHFEGARWPDAARTMLDAVGAWRHWALFTLPDGGAWSKGRVALLGDAAHAMLPFAAQGAGMAIEDAAVLAQCLGDAIDTPAAVPAALQRYATQRLARVTRVQRTARQSGRIYHLRGPMALARDVAMSLLGPTRLQARQAWIYDWMPPRT